jgi:hypothetical protein
VDWRDPIVIVTVVVLPIALFLVTCLVAVVLYVKALRTKSASWHSRNFVLVRDYRARLPELTVSYKGREMSSLEVTRIVFWNSGRVTLEAKDLESFDPVRLTATKGVEILDASTVVDNIGSASSPHFPGDVTTPDEHFSVEKVGSEWRLKLRYLEPQRGAVLQVVHTGSPDRDPVGMEGSIVGASPFEKRLVTVVVALPMPFPRALERRLSFRTMRYVRSGMFFAMVVLLLATTVGFGAIAAIRRDPFYLIVAVLQLFTLLLTVRTIGRLGSSIPIGLEGYFLDPLEPPADLHSHPADA